MLDAQQTNGATATAAWPLCTSCTAPLPLAASPSGGPGKCWVCVGCGKSYKAALVTDAPADVLGNVRLNLEAAAAGGDPLPQSAEDKPAIRGGGGATDARPSRASRDLDDALADPGSLLVRPADRPFAAYIQKPGSGPYDPELEQILGEQFNASLEQVDSLVAAVERGQAIDAGAHESVARDTLIQATRDLDLFVNLGVNPIGKGYPGRHSLHVAMLATGIGAKLGWDTTALIELGVGCLIHDLGMVLLPDKAYELERTLSETEFDQIAAHPLHTFDLLQEHLTDVPLASRMVAYQIHERCNGAGYPRKRRGPLLHEAAKVAAVADVYIALVSPRPHRPPMMPYHAVKYLLHGVKGGLFDAAATRALLETVSLFPIGSFVELTDGRLGRVLRTNPGDYTRPIVETWRRGELDAPPELLDLSREPKLAARKPLPSLPLR